MSYAVYGKRVEGYYNTETRQYKEPDTTFRAINEQGVRVNRLSEARIFKTKQLAEQWLGTKAAQPGVKFEIRKVRI